MPALSRGGGGLLPRVGLLTICEKAVETSYLDAGIVEVQENVGLDVCTQGLTILRGGLPNTGAVSAPLTLHEEYFVREAATVHAVCRENVHAALRAHDQRPGYGGGSASSSCTRGLSVCAQHVAAVSGIG